MIKKILILFSLLILATGLASAQKKGKDREKMFKEVQEYKMKFLAQEMELKEDQRSRFFELYGKMSEEKRCVYREIRKLEKSLKEDSSEARYKEVTSRISELREKDAAIDKRYDAEFSKFLTSKQIYKMKAGEEKFRKKMHEMHGRKHKKK